MTAEKLSAFFAGLVMALAHDRKAMIERLDELKTRTGPAPAYDTEEADIEADLAAPQPEPGDHPNCPYFDEHVFASRIERLLAGELSVNWFEYEKAIEALS